MSQISKNNTPRASEQVERPTAPALITFLDAIDAENSNSSEGNSRVSAETLMQLVDATQNYYESAIRARTYLFGGLAGGAIIGAGIYGLVSHIRQRRNSVD